MNAHNLTRNLRNRIAFRSMVSKRCSRKIAFSARWICCQCWKVN